MIRYALLAAALFASTARAEVKSAAETGFLVEQRLEIAAGPAQVWRRLLRPRLWWSPQHTYSGDAANLRLEARAGGCFCERWAGGEVLHLQTAYVEPGKTLRLLGGLGPLQGMADGALTLTLEPAGAGTVLTLQYQVWGFQPGGLAAIAPAVDQVLGEQLARLKAGLSP